VLARDASEMARFVLYILIRCDTVKLMKKGQCRLCLENKDLCRESHILPKFLYKFLSGENNSILFLNNEKAQLRFNGEYEGDILCQKCDQKVIGGLENYAAKFMQGSSPKNSYRKIINGVEHLVIENDRQYNYTKHRLFLLSLLWRSSISSRPFFKHIKLSVKNEERLRRMILTNTPEEPDVYPIFLHLPPLTTSPEGVVGFNTLHMPTISPVSVKSGGWNICKFVIQGMSFYFLIERPTGTKVEPSVEKNKLLLKFSTLEEQNELIQMSVDMVKNHKK
jgi:hypothetical protein